VDGLPDELHELIETAAVSTPTIADLAYTAYRLRQGRTPMAPDENDESG
jgi:hypothetical protein